MKRDRSDDQSRDAALQQVQDVPFSYLDLAEEYQADHQICLATLLALGHKRGYHAQLSSILKVMDTHSMPHFSDHKAVILALAADSKVGDEVYSLKVYSKRFGRQICDHRDSFVKLAKHGRFPVIFSSFPMKLQSDPKILKLAVKNISPEAFDDFLQATSRQTLAAHEVIFWNALRRRELQMSQEQVPLAFWSNRDFVLAWLKRGFFVGAYLLPCSFRSDRELCLSLFKNVMDVVDIPWISKSLLHDKSFVLKCLSQHPIIFKYCGKELRQDFDVQLQTAFRFISKTDEPFEKLFDCFAESHVPFATRVQSYIRPHEEVMTFLACCWKSRLIADSPLNVLDCDKDTIRGFTTLIAHYVGLSNTPRPIKRFRRVWDEIVALVVARRTLATALIPLVQPNEIAHAVLKAIDNNSQVTLQTFPESLWSNRSFLSWAAKEGLFHESMPKEYSENWVICHACYKRGAAPREKIWRWISDSVKSNKSFILKCTSINPLVILGHYCMVDKGNDFEIILSAVYHAATRGQLDRLVEMARNEGWDDSLIFFAKSVRAKLEAHRVLSKFEAVTSTPFLSSLHSRPLVRSLIGRYLGAPINPEEVDRLQGVWSYHSIFHLALGGNIDDVCKANKFRPEKCLSLHFRKKDQDDVNMDDSCSACIKIPATATRRGGAMPAGTV